MAARDLYIDLLIRSVVDGIYGDPIPGRWRVGNKFDRGARQACSGRSSPSAISRRARSG
jgi:hypothetical protein